MKKEQKMNIVKSVTDYYLKSHDFNGMPFSKISEAHTPLTRANLKSLIKSGDIEIHFGFGHPNPYVKALPLGDIEAQLKTLDYVDDEQIASAVLYPTQSHLTKVVNPDDYKNRPFSLMLAQGMPQLDRLFFDPQILKTYRDDPRYIYDYHDSVGFISIKDESDNAPDSDRVFLETFGAGFSRDYFNDNKTCVVAFPYYLHKLTPEHQMLWNHRLLDDSKYVADQAFIESQLLGSWDFDITMYEAFFAELKVINDMAIAMEGQPLFKKDYSDGSNRPRRFHRILMPTRSEYQEFTEILDKLMSDNINRKFFERSLPTEVLDNSIGTIKLLEDYFGFVRTQDRTPIDEMLKTFRNVRSERSKSSHHDIEDDFNYEYNKKQRELMREAYTAIRLIRLAFTNHQDAKNVDVPDWLYKGKISSI